MIQGREAAHELEVVAAPKFLAPPVDTKIARHDTEPRGESRGTRSAKLPQAAESIFRKPLADKQKTLADGIAFPLSQANGLQNNRRVVVQESRPSFLRLARIQRLLGVHESTARLASGLPEKKACRVYEEVRSFGKARKQEDEALRLAAHGSKNPVITT